MGKLVLFALGAVVGGYASRVYTVAEASEACDRARGIRVDRRGKPLSGLTSRRRKRSR